MRPTISLTALSAVIQEVVSVTISTKWPNNYIHYYLFTHFITHYAYATSMNATGIVLELL